MVELLTEVPETGTRLRIEADRELEGPTGDSTLRITGSHDGSATFDATYVEVQPQEAELVGWFLRSLSQPPQEVYDYIGQEIQAVFGSRLTGRDCHQIAELAWKGFINAVTHKAKMDVTTMTGGYDEIGKLAERFERAASRGKSWPTGSPTSSSRSQGEPSGKGR